MPPPPGFVTVTSIAILRSMLGNASVSQVWLPEGTHLRLGGEELSFARQDITLRSEGTGAILDAEGLSRVVTVGENALLAVEDGVVLFDGRADTAGGCALSGAGG